MAPPLPAAPVEASPALSASAAAPTDDLSWAEEDPAPDPDDDGTFEVRSSGLGVDELNPGSGPQVKTGDKIAVHYVGRLEDGTVFDSSRERGTPLTFRIGDGHMIKGWEEGLLGMRVGGIRKLIVPPHLAYGAHGSGRVPPNALLEFVVEVVDIAETAP